MIVYETSMELTQIKPLRRKYHLTQKDLAQHATVSQSLIAKIEAGKMDPSYTKAQQIFKALEALQQKQEVKAGSVMKTKIIFATVHDPLKDIIKTMRSKGISQVPVLQREKVCGIITETTILEKIAEHPEKINTLKAAEVMEEAPPTIPLATGLHTIVELLRSYPLLLVAEKGEIKGIISKADVLGRIE